MWELQPGKTGNHEKYVSASRKEAKSPGWEKSMFMSSMMERQELAVREGLFELRMIVSTLLIMSNYRK